jgi:hypothetical protein
MQCFDVKPVVEVNNRLSLGLGRVLFLDEVGEECLSSSLRLENSRWTKAWNLFAAGGEGVKESSFPPQVPCFPSK